MKKLVDYKEGMEVTNDAKLPVSNKFSDAYSEEWRLKTHAAKLRWMIASGYGRTNKQLSPKRLKELKEKLEEIEAILNAEKK